MTQKPREPDLEQVKSLLRRLEEIPEPKAPASPLRQERDFRKPGPGEGSNVVGLPTPPNAPATRPAAQPPVVQPPVLQAPVLQPPVSRPPSTQTKAADRPVAHDRLRDADPAPLLPQALPRSQRLLWVAAGALVIGGCGILYLAWPSLSAKQEAAGLLQNPARGVKSAIGARVEPAQPVVAAPERATTAAPQSAVIDAKLDPKIPAVEATAAVPPAAVPSPTATLQTSPSAASAVLPTTLAVPAETGRQNAPSAALAPAPPPAKHSALPEADNQDEELQNKLVRQGQQMLTQGHVASARLLFRRAADSGSAEAAILLGDTFDPQRLSALGVRGIAGDVQQSVRWYEKADELGAAEAKERLLSLAGR